MTGHNSPTEALRGLRERLDMLDGQSIHATSGSLLEWRIRCLEIDLELLKVETMIRMADKGWPVDYSA